MCGRYFQSDEDVVHATEEYLEAQDVTLFHEGIVKETPLKNNARTIFLLWRFVGAIFK